MRLSLLICIPLLVGCVRVPTSELRFGNATAVLPKDSSADELKIFVQNGTNIFRFEALNWSTKNNPSVISASAEQIKAHYAGASIVIKEGVAAGVAAGAKTVVPVP